MAVAALLIAVAACSPAPKPVAMSGEHDGLVVEGQVTDTGSSIAVEVVVRNQRDEVVHLETDQCGRIMDVELERTTFRRQGRHWGGSIQAAKELVLDAQRFDDDADSFAPRRVGDHSSAVPECQRPDHAIPLEPGASIAERWELPFADSRRSRRSDRTRPLSASRRSRRATRPRWSTSTSSTSSTRTRTVPAASPVPSCRSSGVLERAPTEPVTGPTRASCSIAYSTTRSCAHDRGPTG